MSARIILCAAAILASNVSAATAHHSFSMFDRNQTVTLTGTIKGLDWVNPHAWLRVMVVSNGEAEPDEWSLEMGGPGQMQRQGWRQDSVKEGDKVTVRMHPLRDKSYGGQFVSIVLPDGRALGQR